MKAIRIGSYGDPFAIPQNIFRDLFNFSKDEGKFKIQAPKKHKGKSFLGYVLYEGVSHLGDDPIVVIATNVDSYAENIKTGNMVQIWIMLKDIAPHNAGARSKSVCGNCAYRHDKGGLCYVRLGEAPLSIWNAYKRGRYSLDPMGLNLIRNWIFHKGHTAYSESAIRFLNHKTLGSYAQFVASKVMLSAKTAKEADRLNGLGFKTFRPVFTMKEARPYEDLCASDRIGLECVECMECSGSNSKNSHVVLVHGAKKNELVKIGGQR